MLNVNGNGVVFLERLKEYFYQEKKYQDYAECDQMLNKIDKYQKEYGLVKIDDGKYI